MYVSEICYCSRCMRELEDEGVCSFCGYVPEPDYRRREQVLEEGTLLKEGRYQMGATLGEGGFGITYAAWDFILQRPVAIKEYFPWNYVQRNTDESDEVVVPKNAEQVFLLGFARFKREAQILSSLQNVQGVVAVHDWFEKNGTAYLVMEFVRGITLEAYVEEKKPSTQELLEMLREPIDALVAIHALGVLHRDISPSNLMVQEDKKVKLIDFGAAAVLERQAQGRDRTVIVNKRYAALEQYDANGEQGPWTDVYGMSATLYALLVGEAPKEAPARQMSDNQEMLQELVRKQGRMLKPWQEKAIRDGLALYPQKRTRSMAEFRARLYHLPLPEEVLQRKRMLQKGLIVGSSALVALTLLTVNLSYGFPLGDGIYYSWRGGGLQVSGFHGEQEDVSIPKSRLGIPVSVIQEEVFRDNQTLKTVRLPESIKKLGNHAFADCPNLHSVYLPESVEDYGERVFSGASESLMLWGSEEGRAAAYAEQENLPFADMQEYSYEMETTDKDGVALLAYQGDAESLRMPDYIEGMPVTGVLSNEEGIASGYPVLTETVTEVQLPKYLYELPAGVLTKQEQIKEVQLGSELEVLGTLSLAGMQLDEVLLPDKLKKIGDGAFYQSRIRQVTIPEGVESIGAEAFSRTWLEEVILPDSVTQLGKAAFSICVELENVQLSSNLKEIADGMFEGCRRLKTVTIQDGVERIGMFAFSKCDLLESIKLPEGTKEIGNYAFSEDVNLKVVFIPNSVTNISDTAFDGCSQSLVLCGNGGSAAEAYAEKWGFPFVDMLKWDIRTKVTDSGGFISIVDGDESEEYEIPSYFFATVVKSIENARNLKGKKVVVPEHVEELATLSFLHNSYLEELVVPDTLQAIGDMTFFGCTNLRKLELPEQMDSIEASAFYGCAALTELTLPKELKNLGGNAFFGCSQIKELNIPDVLPTLPDECFGGVGIETLTIPSNVSKCRAAFLNCTKLREVTVEEGVHSLLGSFGGCTSLESIVIPSTLSRISRSTFQGCENLRDVWIYSKDVNLDTVEYGLVRVKELDYRPEEMDDGVQMESENIESDDTPRLFSDSPNVTIHAYEGSTAETFAKEHGIAFEALP